jgi:hypothetical protein
MKYKFWEVQTQIGNDWENIWTVTNPDGDHERPDIFTTMEDAEDQLRLHLKSMDIEGMDYDPADYRVQYVEIDPTAQADVRDAALEEVAQEIDSYADSNLEGAQLEQANTFVKLIRALKRTPADDSQKGGEA